jgi:hypothetical protein
MLFPKKEQKTRAKRRNLKRTNRTSSFFGLVFR